MAPKDRTLLSFFKKKDTSSASSSPTPARSSQSQHASNSSSPAPSASSVSKKRPPIQIEASSDVEPDPITGTTPQTVSSKKPRLSPINGQSETPASDTSDAPQGSSVLRKKSGSKRPVIQDSDDDEDPATSPAPTKKPRTEQKNGLANSNGSGKGQRKKAKTAASGDDDFIVSDNAEDSDDYGLDADDDLGAVDWDMEETKATQSIAAPSSTVKSKAANPPKESAKKPYTQPKLAPKPPAAKAKGLNVTDRKQAEKKSKKDQEDIFEFLKTPLDADKNPVGHPDYDPRTLYISNSLFEKLTPFEKQFWEIKKNHMDVVLFFQKGKFYELYENDAIIGHQEFDLKLTERVKMSMVGVPEAQFDDWAHKFLARGYKVGRVDQCETALGAEMKRAKDKEKEGKGTGKAPAKDKLVGRELKSVLTSATLVDGIVEDLSKHCVAIKESQSESPIFGVCALDASTAKFDLAWFPDDVSRTKLGTLLRQIRPKEVIVEKHNMTTETSRVLKNTLPLDCSMVSMKAGSEFLSGEGALHQFKAYTEKMDLPEAVKQLQDKDEAMSAMGGMLSYLKELNLDRDLCTAGNFNIFNLHKRETMQLDGQTLAHIEVLQNSLGETDGTLYKLMNRCITPSGKRLFKLWLCQPLSEASSINARLDAIDDFIANPSLTEDFGKATKGAPDLERLLSRIHAGSCKPSQFARVLSSLSKISKTFASLAKTSNSLKSSALKSLLAGVPDLSDHLDAVREIYEEDEGMLVPKDGADEAFDQTGESIEEVETELQATLQKYRKELGLSSSEIKFKDIGTKDIYQVEVPIHTDVPADWTAMSGTSKIKRYYTPVIMQLVRQMKELRETRTLLRNEFQGKLYKRFSEQYRVYLSVVKSAAEFDCLHALAKTSSSLGEPSVRPEIVDSPCAFVDFEQLRHPCLLSADIDFIPNDVQLGGNKQNMALITGPNMAGKSTLLRMTAAAVIMAQVGCYVPATKARIAPFDKICTRMGANDFIFNATSTFKVEMDDCKKIISESTPRSLVILDELGRGTSTFDGVAIAFAVLHHLATHKTCIGFFSTHYNSLVRDFAYHSQIRACHMSTVDVDGNIVFSYTLKDGPTLKSYGPHVARMAGVPEEIVARAMHVSQNFEKQSLQKQAEKRKDQQGLPLPLQDDARYIAQVPKVESMKDTFQLLSTLSVIKENMAKLPSTRAAVE